MAQGSDPIVNKANPDFIEEFQRCWRQLPDKGLLGVLLAVWVGTFMFLGNSTFGYIDTPSLFQWMYQCYSVPEADDGHGLLIPFVVLFVLWGKRNELLALPRKPWAPAIVLLTSAVLLHLLGYAAQQPRFSIIAFFLGFHALISIMWGKGWFWATLMPFSIFAFCVPISSLEVIKNLTMPLRLLATHVSVAIAHGALGFQVTSLGTQIFDSAGMPRYEVAAGCSGIRSLISLFVLMTVFGMISYRSPWRRLSLMFLSIPIALFCNVLRLLSVITAGEVFGFQAGVVAHEYSGFFTYAIAILCMVVLAKWWTEKEPESHAPAISNP